MIISRTPFRLSFLGGGTDYPAWYREHGGAVLGTTINKYCHLTCRYLPPFFEHRYNVVWSKIENCKTIDEITHPAAREIIRYMGITRGLEIHHDGDLPARSGTGSSSSYSVGLLNALYALQGKMVSKTQLMSDSLHVEQNILKENVGSQDQVFASQGGLNHIQFQTDDEIVVTPMTLTPARLKELESHIMLFYTGIRRTASDMVQTYQDQFEKNAQQLRLMMELVDEGVAMLSDNSSILDFGRLMHEGWLIKRALGSSISNDTIDDMYATALCAGAIGGKLSGAGGGGFMMLFAPPHAQKRIRDAFHSFVHVPFQFERLGSQIIYCENEEDFEEQDREREQQDIAPFCELDDIKIAAGKHR